VIQGLGRLLARHGRLPLWVTAVAACLLQASIVEAKDKDIETLGAHCNDAPFGSDGGGISGCIDLAARYRDWSAGLSLTGVTPEQKIRGTFRNDPLEEKARFAAWVAKDWDWNSTEFGLSLRAGAEGGEADDVALAIKDQIHNWAGIGNRELYSHNSTEFIVGTSGWLRSEYELGGFKGWNVKALPYGHGTLGLDSVEAGGGLMLALQPAAELRNMALVLPKTAAYAVPFGGDGIAIFGGLRAVAHEGLYGKLANPIVAEAGITAQTTLFSHVRVGISASCTTQPYEGAHDPDCKMTFQLGGLF
jgi:hypothetical protein